jgi:hypothetical protein
MFRKIGRNRKKSIEWLIVWVIISLATTFWWTGLEVFPDLLPRFIYTLEIPNQESRKAIQDRNSHPRAKIHPQLYKLEYDKRHMTKRL